MVDVKELEGKVSVKLDVGLKLLQTIDNLNKHILEADAPEIRAITDGIEDIALLIKKLYSKESESE